MKQTLETVNGEFESFGELLSVHETGTESSFHLLGSDYLTFYA